MTTFTQPRTRAEAGVGRGGGRGDGGTEGGETKYSPTGRRKGRKGRKGGGIPNS